MCVSVCVCVRGGGGGGPVANCSLESHVVRQPSFRLGGGQCHSAPSPPQPPTPMTTRTILIGETRERKKHASEVYKNYSRYPWMDILTEKTNTPFTFNWHL